MLSPPDKFEFPFSPYPIQHEFMSNLYSTIELKQLGIFESPTGTGKSLSILCGALKWLKDHNESIRNNLKLEIQVLSDQKANINANLEEDEDWISTQSKELDIAQKLNELQLESRKIDEYDKKIIKLKKRDTEIKAKKRFTQNSKAKNGDLETNLIKANDGDCEDDDNLLLEELDNKNEESDEEEAEEDKFEEVKVLSAKIYPFLSCFLHNRCVLVLDFNLQQNPFAISSISK